MGNRLDSRLRGNDGTRREEETFGQGVRRGPETRAERTGNRRDSRLRGNDGTRGEEETFGRGVRRGRETRAERAPARE
jgi:hypothetical protein